VAQVVVDAVECHAEFCLPAVRAPFGDLFFDELFGQVIGPSCFSIRIAAVPVDVFDNVSGIFSMGSSLSVVPLPNPLFLLSFGRRFLSGSYLSRLVVAGLTS
jgi:hypothetical protein